MCVCVRVVAAVQVQPLNLQARAKTRVRVCQSTIPTQHHRKTNSHISTWGGEIVAVTFACSTPSTSGAIISDGNSFCRVHRFEFARMLQPKVKAAFPFHSPHSTIFSYENKNESYWAHTIISFFCWHTHRTPRCASIPAFHT